MCFLAHEAFKLSCHPVSLSYLRKINFRICPGIRAGVARVRVLYHTQSLVCSPLKYGRLKKRNATKHIVAWRKFGTYDNELYGEPFQGKEESITRVASSEGPFQDRRLGRGVTSEFGGEMVVLRVEAHWPHPISTSLTLHLQDFSLQNSPLTYHFVFSCWPCCSAS
jgi:hypothetical protein